MPRIIDHDARRDSILERCFELFARVGYGAVTMRGIAREVGLSTGTLYHYFPDKATLARSLFHRVSRQDVAEATVQLQAGETRGERLAALLGFVVANEERLRATLLVAMDHHRQHPDDREVLQQAAATYREALREQLELPADGAGLDGVLLTLLLGTIAHRTLDPEGFEAAPHLTAIEALLEALISS